MKRKLLIGLAVMVACMGCRKDDLNVAELNTNPFDADYAGPAIFEKLGQRTTSYVDAAGVVHRTLEMDIRIHTSAIPASGGYGVRYRAQHWSSSVIVPAADLADGRFTLSVPEAALGVDYCVDVRLANGGGVGGGNTLCGTVE